MTPALTIEPRMLSRDQAAAFCGLTVRKLNAAVREGVLPGPVTVAGEDLWHVERLRSSLDALAGWAPDRPQGNRAADRVKAWSR